MSDHRREGTSPKVIASETTTLQQIVVVEVDGGMAGWEVVVSRNRTGDDAWQRPWVSLPRPGMMVSDWSAVERAVHLALAEFSEKFLKDEQK